MTDRVVKSVSNPAHIFVRLALERILSEDRTLFLGGGLTRLGSDTYTMSLDYVLGVSVTKPPLAPALDGEVEEIKKDFIYTDSLKNGDRQKYVAKILLRKYRIPSGDWVQATLASLK